MSQSRKDFLKQAALGTAALPFLNGLTSIREKASSRINEISTDASLASLKKHYLLSKDITYLNHASIGTIPKPVHDARNEYLELCETNPWQYMWSGDWDDPREEVRQKMASYINAKIDEITFNHNTTEAFNLLAHGLGIGKGDDVLFSNLNHAGASICFEEFAPKYGYTVKTFDIPVQKIAALTKEKLLNLYNQHITSATKLLVMPHIDNTVGLRHPVKEIAQLARDKGVDYIAVDAAQTVGMIPIDVKELGIDLLATSAHKWIQAPKGISFAYISENMQQELQPMWVTWGQGREAWKNTARKYEDYGTRNLAELLTLGHALDFQNNISWNDRTGHLKKLWNTAQQLADGSSAVAWASHRDWEMMGSLYAIEIKKMKSSAFFQKMFDTHGFVFRPFETMGLNTVRVSPNVITSEEELEQFFAMAEKV